MTSVCVPHHSRCRSSPRSVMRPSSRGPIATTPDLTDDPSMPVVVGIGILLIVGVTWRRQNTGARIGAIIASLLVLWVTVAIVNPASAALLAGGVANGFRGLVTGIGEFLGGCSERLTRPSSPVKPNCRPPRRPGRSRSACTCSPRQSRRSLPAPGRVSASACRPGPRSRRS